MGNKDDSDIIIEMKPDARGVFTAGKVPQGRVRRNVRPEKKSRRKAPVRDTVELNTRQNNPPVDNYVPTPLDDFQEGIQAGLEIYSGIKTAMRLFK